jgi:epsin
LLEFLIKNGSERVIDDARSHLSLLRMLRQFHFIDANGKDQGINVRNRAKELSELLSDVDKIRAERKKARATRNKYSGVEGGAGISSGMTGSSGRYGGFGSESGGYGGYSGGVYGDGGGFGGEEHDVHEAGSSKGKDQFEEYDEFDDGATPSSRPSQSSHVKREISSTTTPKKETKQPAKDLFSFDDDIPAVSAPSATSAQKQAPADDDDFDDFVSAAVPTPQAAPARLPTSTGTIPTSFNAPKPAAPQVDPLADLFASSNVPPPAPSSGFSSFASPTMSTSSAGFQTAQPNYFTSVPTGAATPSLMSSKTSSNAPSKAASPAAKPAASAFGSLWSSASVNEKKVSAPTAGPKLSSLAKEKASAGIWGAPAASTPSGQSSQTAGGQKLGNGLDDLLG